MLSTNPSTFDQILEISCYYRCAFAKRWYVVLILNLAAKFVSFNCRGFQSSEDDVQLLAMQADVLMVQEHWLRPEQFPALGRIGDGEFVYTAVSTMKSGEDCPGRPYGGVAMLWKRTLQRRVSVLRTGSDRICDC